MKAVILAGGLGTRLREETEFKPKPMVEVGNRPILWHIMKTYAYHGVRDFIICVGYKGDVIRDYFLNYEARNNDFTITLGKSHELSFHDAHYESDWNVTVAETGAETMTGGRVKKITKYLDGETFCVTYGDGVADVNIAETLQFHRDHGKIATVTTVRPPSRFGLLELDPAGAVQWFSEKPHLDGWINGGYFVFEPQVLDYLDEQCVLEQAPLVQLTKDSQLVAYRHEGYWQPMDTYREAVLLNEAWDTGAPWKVWE